MERVIKAYYSIGLRYDVPSIDFTQEDVGDFDPDNIEICQHIDNWPDLFFYFQKESLDAQMPDYIEGAISFPIVSQRFKALIEDIEPEAVQFLHIKLINDDNKSEQFDYWVMNVLQCVEEAVCWEYSDWNKDLFQSDPEYKAEFPPADKPLAYMSYPAFKYDFVKNHHIFRYKEGSEISTDFIISDVLLSLIHI